MSDEQDQVVDLTEDDLEIEIQDDTPEEDRGRVRKTETPEPAAAPVAEDDDEDLAKHSESVQKRIKKLKFEYHEERRQKEAAAREREAAIEYAEKIKRENDNLRKNLTEGESVLITQAKARVTSELAAAKRAFKEAYEAGDSEAVVEHQMKLVRLQTEADRVDQWQANPRTVAEPEATHAPAARPRVPEPDPKAKAWVGKNDWFQRDTGMTRYAMLVHEELIESGVDSTSDLYYTKIDQAMRSRYPDRFAADTEVQQPQRKVGSVVAPGGRNSAASRTKVVITSSEAAIAKRLGISLKDYAAQKLKDMQND
jgi:hypothetical protein